MFLINTHHSCSSSWCFKMFLTKAFNYGFFLSTTLDETQIEEYSSLVQLFRNQWQQAFLEVEKKAKLARGRCEEISPEGDWGALNAQSPEQGM